MAAMSTSSIHLTLLNKGSQRPQGRVSHTSLVDHDEDFDVPESKLGKGLKQWDFVWLVIPVTIAIMNLIINSRRLTFGGKVYSFVTGNRASISVVVQIFSTCLGMIMVACTSRLFNLSSRIAFSKRPVELKTLQFWNGVSSATIQWSLRPTQFVLLCTYVALSALPGAIWAGALTPVVTTTNRNITVQTPQYSNTSLIREYPSEVHSAGPILRNKKGLFSYSMGVLNVGQLTESLATATTIDGSPRRHIKFDNSEFVYVGRSYGIGASVGLVDDDILGDPYLRAYSFREKGYDTRVSCEYNFDTQFFHISNDSSVGPLIFPVEGYLSDSTGSEFSYYVGHGTEAIVAFGVAASPLNSSSTTRYVGIAAGQTYENLDAVECKLEMDPTLFDVVVNRTDRSIMVSSIDVGNFPNIEPSGNLTHAATRQFELYSNDLTNIYQSVAGNALNFSISDYRTLIAGNVTDQSDIASLNSSAITLRGIENSVTAMMDDILTGYASAQLMIANDSAEVAAVLSLNAIRIGKPVFIYLILSINIFIIILIIEETIRTNGWRQLPTFNYTDLAHLAVSSSKGGPYLAQMVSSQANNERIDNTRHWWSSSSSKRIMIRLRREDSHRFEMDQPDSFSIAVA